MESADIPVTLALTVRTLGDATRALMVAGEVDVYTAPRLAETVQEQVSQGVLRLLVHLADVEYMDSTGLSVLIQGNTLFQEAGGKFVLIGPRPRIARLFEITGLNTRLNIVGSEAEGLTV